MNGAAPYGFFYSVGLRIYSVELCVTKKATDLSASGGVTGSRSTEKKGKSKKSKVKSVGAQGKAPILHHSSLINRHLTFHDE